jgi:DNA polymerase V
MAYIGLVDCNNFFVSCERLFRPDLLNKPVVVLSSNDGCVVARSQEVKDMGIAMGVPYFQVKDILTKSRTTVFSSHFALYRDISARVFKVIKSEFGEIEQYSIDECFFEVNESQAESVARRLKVEVMRQVGIPVSVGIGQSKTIAKYASRLAKKTNGVKVLPDTTWQSMTKEIALGEIWGVGSGRIRQFTNSGLKTVYDLIQLPLGTVDRLLGIEGVRLWNELKGKSVLPVSSKLNPHKTMMSTRSFAKATANYSVVKEALLYHVYEVVKDLQANNQLASAVRVLIYPSRHGNYVLQGASLEAFFLRPTNDIFTLQNQAIMLLDKCYKTSVPYQKAGIIVTGLVDTVSQSGSLFIDDNTKKEILTETIYAINKKLGKSLIGLGQTVNKNASWMAKQNLKSPEYTTRWNELCTVKA